MSQAPPDPNDRTPPSGTQIPRPESAPPPAPQTLQQPPNYPYVMPPPAYPYPLQAPPRSSPTTLSAVLVALYMIVLSIVNACSAMLVLGCGGFLSSVVQPLQAVTNIARGGADNALNDVASSLGWTIEGNTASAAEAIPDVGGIAALAAGLITLLGIISLAIAVALLVSAIGLFLAKRWSYIGAIALNAIFIATQLAGAVIGSVAGIGGLSIFQIIFVILSGVSIVVLLFDENMRRSFLRS